SRCARCCASRGSNGRALQSFLPAAMPQSHCSIGWKSVAELPRDRSSRLRSNHNAPSLPARRTRVAGDKTPALPSSGPLRKYWPVGQVRHRRRGFLATSPGSDEFVPTQHSTTVGLSPWYFVTTRTEHY